MAAAFRPWGLALLALGLVGLCRPAGASVVLQTGNFSAGFIDLPADFGPDVPEEGLTGLLLLADPEAACSSLRPPPASKAPWIALVARSQNIAGCTFEIKVAQAEAAGAIAAIIFDDAIEPLILMAKDPRHPDPFIPAVFVSHRSGLMMKRLIEEGKTVVMLTPSSEAIWLSMLMSACAGFLAVNIVLGALWVMRRQRIVAGGGVGYGPLQQQGMSLESIRQLPIVVYEEPAGVQAGREAADGGSSSGGSGSAPLQQRPDGGSDSGSDSGRKGGGTRHTCAICLESYQNSDKLRVLPCQHRYHSECVDQWLSSRHPCCPVCKADAHPRTPGDDLEAGTAGPPRWQRRGMLLLGRLGGGWLALRTRFVGSGAEGAAADGDGGSRGAVGDRTALLLGSRSGSPGPPAGPLAQPVATQAAQVAAQQALFPASASTSGGALRVLSAGVQPEITPVEAADSGVAATTFEATLTTVAAASTTSTVTAGAVSPRLPASAAQTESNADPDCSPSGSSGPSPGTSYCATHAVGPDSTEGSETDSEAE